MKDRKQLQHMDLVNEVIRQLSHRFQPTPQMIKKSIERLIEKEYVERDDEDRKKLKYMVRFRPLPLSRRTTAYRASVPRKQA
jgi:cullin 3